MSAQPLSLTNQTRISKAGLEKVEHCLAGGCWTCDKQAADIGLVKLGTASLTRRRVGASVVVYLQCDTCGSSTGGAFSRADHPFWQDYREWNETLRLSVEQRIHESYEQTRAQHETAANYQKLTRESRAEAYSRWLLTSPAWHALRRLVWKRANGTCEACLDARATDVHHDTYELGKLPPAWLLHAVCRPCHERLHGGWRDEDEAA